MKYVRATSSRKQQPVAGQGDVGRASAVWLQPVHCLLHFTRKEKADDEFGFRFRREEYQRHREDKTVVTATLDWTQELLDALEKLRNLDVDRTVAQWVGRRIRRFLGEAGWGEQESTIKQAVLNGRPVFVTIPLSGHQDWSKSTAYNCGKKHDEQDGALASILKRSWNTKYLPSGLNGSAAMMTASFSGDGKRLITPFLDGRTRVWTEGPDGSWTSQPLLIR